MLTQNQIHKLFSFWSKLSYSKLLNINQINGVNIEFVIDNSISSKIFFEKLQKITIKKHPSGSVSFIGYWGEAGKLNSQYKKYRIDFIDHSIKEKINDNKLNLYFNEVISILN